MSKVVFSVDGKALIAALSGLNKLISGKADTIEINAVRGKDSSHLLLRATAEMYTAVFKLDALVRHGGQFSVNKAILDGIFKGRNKLDIVVSDDGLAFSEAKSDYSGKNITLLPDPNDDIKFETPKNDLIPHELQKLLLAQMGSAIICPTVAIDNSIGVHMMVRKDRLVVAASDNLHAAITSRKLDEKLAQRMRKFATVIPVEYVGYLASFEAEGLSIAIGSDSIRVSNKQINASFPSLQIDDKYTLDAILDFANKQGKPSMSCEIDGSKMAAALDNLQVVHEQGEATLVSLRNGKLFLGYRTKFGQVEDAIAAEDIHGDKNASIRLETSNLFDLLSHLGGKITISFYGNKLAGFQRQLDKATEARYFVAALPEEDEDKPVKVSKPKVRVREDA